MITMGGYYSLVVKDRTWNLTGKIRIRWYIDQSLWYGRWRSGRFLRVGRVSGAPVCCSLESKTLPSDIRFFVSGDTIFSLPRNGDKSGTEALRRGER